MKVLVACETSGIVRDAFPARGHDAWSCASCHVAAKKDFDFVCEKGHGCAPLGVTDSLIASIQNSDPRPKQ